MAKIENLRNRAFDALGKELSKKMPITTFVNGYIVGAQDQDRIARQEERDRCVKAACNWICRSFCNCGDPNGCSVICRSMTEEKIRKEIEEGGNR